MSLSNLFESLFDKIKNNNIYINIASILYFFTSLLYVYYFIINILDRESYEIIIFNFFDIILFFFLSITFFFNVSYLQAILLGFFCLRFGVDLTSIEIYDFTNKDYLDIFKIILSNISSIIGLFIIFSTVVILIIKLILEKRN